MTKKDAIAYINSSVPGAALKNSNTHYANISASRNAWWMNISVEKFRTIEINIIFVGKAEFHWLQIPAGTFMEPAKYFRIWETKKAVDLYVSSDPRDRYMKDAASEGTGVDFRPFLKRTFPDVGLSEEPVTEELKTPPGPKSPADYQLIPAPRNRKIKAGETNLSYKLLFADYLKGATTITIQDPYIRLPHQFDNLVEFGQMLSELKEPEMGITLEIISSNDEGFKKNSISNFEEFATSLKASNINLKYRFAREHDRYIETNTGWKIVLGRGLDIFEKPEGRFTLAAKDQSRRKCKSCEVTYVRI